MIRRSISTQILLALSILAMVLLLASGRPAQATVICGEGQQTVIYTDASGTPVDPLAPCDCPACDHCLPVPSASLDQPVSLDLRRDLITIELRPALPGTASRMAFIASVARGPPAHKGLI